MFYTRPLWEPEDTKLFVIITWCFYSEALGLLKKFGNISQNIITFGIAQQMEFSIMDFWTFCVVQEFNWFSMGDEPTRFFKQTLNKKKFAKTACESRNADNFATFTNWNIWGILLWDTLRFILNSLRKV